MQDATSLGKRKLMRYLKNNNISKNQFAKMLGIHRTTLHRYIKNLVKIPLICKIAIENLTNGYIKISDWDKSQT